MKIKWESWGNLSHEQAELVRLDSVQDTAKIIGNLPSKGIAFGMGRSYGDEALNPSGCVVLTTGMNKLLAFDQDRGVLKCEAGVTLQDIQRTLGPKGWLLPVTPGTQMVTVGGAIANDVHGKNHHGFGSFCDHVLELTLVRTTGEVIDCGPVANADWFYATAGGAGLTGVIVSAALQLRRVWGPWVDAQTISYTSLDDFFELSESSEKEWEQTVSWIDCLNGKEGRGLFMRGNLSSRQNLAWPTIHNKNFFISPPGSLVNRLSLPIFNQLYYHKNKLKHQSKLVFYESFFYPLDAIQHWNRMYGPNGFYQYQCVIPPEDGKVAVAQMLKEIKQSGEGSFLAVLKTFGNRKSGGLLSFPMPGVTLALDFPNRGCKTLDLFSRLDKIVLETKGRLYLAKDARMPRVLFESGYPKIEEFLKYRDPGISSAMSRRLLGD